MLEAFLIAGKIIGLMMIIYAVPVFALWRMNKEKPNGR
jgi:hypothetical protein